MENWAHIDTLYRETISIADNTERIAVMSITVPVEIIRAAGMLPYRLYGTRDGVMPEIVSMLSSNLCSYIQSCFHEGISGYQQHFQGAVVADTCDTRKKLYEAWKYYYPGTRLHSFNTPKVDSGLSREYFRDALVSLISFLESSFHCRIEDNSLDEAIKEYNTMRTLLGELVELKPFYSDILPASRIHNIIKAGFNSNPREFNEKLSHFIDAVKNLSRGEPGRKIKVLLCGSYLDNESILDLIEKFNGLIVCVNNSFGCQFYSGQIGSTEDPLGEITEYYYNKSLQLPYFNTAAGVKNVNELIDKHDIDCVIYTTLKFCDCNAITFCDIRKSLKDRSLPVLYFEMEHSMSNIENIITRIETFMGSI